MPRKKKTKTLKEQIVDRAFAPIIAKAGKPSKTILEKFQWLTAFKFPEKQGEKVVPIKGIALYAGAVSRNLRKYTEEEVMMAARTLKGKPITVNHDPNRIIGNVEIAEFEDGAVEFVGYIKNREYVEKLRDSKKVFNKKMSVEEYFKKWGSYPLQHVSIEAEYLKLKCPKCGQEFVDFDDYIRHMEEVEKVKNTIIEPRHIYITGLSIVEYPEQPGIPDAKFEILETYRPKRKHLIEFLVKQPGHKSILEMLANQIKKERSKKMSQRFVAQRERHLALYPDRLKEQEETPQCGEGEVWDPVQQKCVPKPEIEEQEEQPETPPAEEPHVCPEGQVWDAEQGKCVPKPETTVKEQEHECPEGYVWDPVQGNCVPKEPETTTETPEVTVTTETLTDKDKQYISEALFTMTEQNRSELWGGRGPGFENCVAYFMEDKGLPEENARRLCAWIGRKTGKIPEMLMEQEQPPPETPQVKVEHECPEGYKWDPETGNCVPIEPPMKEAPPPMTTETFRLPAKIKFKGLSESIEKRGNQWCVVHCHGPDAGKVIKCFDTRAEAEAMHRAIMANETFTLIEQDGRPPKEWWDRCTAYVSKTMPEYTDEQVAAVCGHIYYHMPGGKSATFETAKGLVEAQMKHMEDRLLFNSILMNESIRKQLETIHHASIIRDQKVAAPINMLIEQVGKIPKALNGVLAEIKRLDARINDIKLAPLATEIAKTKYDLKNMQRQLKEMQTRYGETTEALRNLNKEYVKFMEEQQKQKEIAETIQKERQLSEVLTEFKDYISKMNDKLENFGVRLDNLEANQKGEFKGNAKPLEPPEKKEYVPRGNPHEIK